ncbi:MAG: hypothetical protein ACTH1D_01875 [Mycobacteriaceae bacterium]|uniref:hypothetical protein n=1 Tax=Corynebacterium sp. TaxID=1720 RepID=UPI003F964B42
MRFTWNRLQADRPLSSIAVMLVLSLALALFTYSSMVGLQRGWQNWSSVAGGLIFPAFAALLVIATPARYRVYGLTMGHWLIDHGVLVVMVLAMHLTWPIVASSGSPADSGGLPGWALFLPVVGIGLTVTAILWHYRHILAGRTTGTSGASTGTPWYYRFFLARRGPLVWRVIHQPLGLVAATGAAVLLASRAFGVLDEGSPVVFGIVMTPAIAVAPVAAASRETAKALGISKWAWFRHALVAITGPLAVAGVVAMALLGFFGGRFPLRYGGLVDGDPLASMSTTHVLLYLCSVLATAVVAAALSIAISYEDWVTAFIWLWVTSWILVGVTFVAFGTGSAWLAVLGLGANLLIAWGLVAHARTKTLIGQPEWTMTSIIGGPRRRAAN